MAKFGSFLSKYGTLLNTGNNTKSEKSNLSGLGFSSSIMYLAPHKNSGVNLCPSASRGCAASCLFTAGYGRYKRVQQSRLNKTMFYLRDRDNFKRQLFDEIKTFRRRCHKNNLVPAVRLNGTSDIAWEQRFPSMFDTFPDVQFYDYTKIFARMMRFLDGRLPVNYHLTFSRSEDNEQKCMEVLKGGGNISAVFRNELPPSYKGYNVVSGDGHDFRFLDPAGVIVGLIEKGRAKSDDSGFVIGG